MLVYPPHMDGKQPLYLSPHAHIRMTHISTSNLRVRLSHGDCGESCLTAIQYGLFTVTDVALIVISQRFEEHSNTELGIGVKCYLALHQRTERSLRYGDGRHQCTTCSGWFVSRRN